MVRDPSKRFSSRSSSCSLLLVAINNNGCNLTRLEKNTLHGDSM